MTKSHTQLTATARTGSAKLLSELQRGRGPRHAFTKRSPHEVKMTPCSTTSPFGSLHAQLRPLCHFTENTSLAYVTERHMIFTMTTYERHAHHPRMWTRRRSHQERSSRSKPRLYGQPKLASIHQSHVQSQNLLAWHHVL